MNETENLHLEVMKKNATDVSILLKSLAHPARLKILCFLLDGEKNVNELIGFCETSQSAVSQYLIRMKHEGLLSSRRDGIFMYYRITDTKLIELINSLKRIYCPTV